VKRRALAAIAALLLTGCDAAQICDACLNADTNKRVSPQLYHKIGFAYGTTPVPPNARNLYYHEQCGIDCQYYAMFELPDADATKFAETIRPLKSSPQDCWESEKAIDSPKINWWPPKLTKNARMSCGDINVKNDRYVDVALEKNGTNTKLYVYSWTM
jgi:hypothetical protein